MRFIRTEDLSSDDQNITDDEVIFAATRDEMETLSNAINETLEAIEEWEFDTRVGVTRKQARELQGKIGVMLQESFRPE